MPKIPTLTSRVVIRILEKKGYVLERSKGSHHIYRHSESKKIAIIPVHRKDLPHGTLMEILKQAGISMDELQDLL